MFHGAVQAALDKLGHSGLSDAARERASVVLHDRATDSGEAASQAAFLSEITVEGFRGVGPSQTLSIKPGPGLTLVVGRNGSGKSSFVEGLEVALTGTSARWDNRRADWKSGWRNLHNRDTCRVEARFQIEGRSGPTTVARTWDRGAELDDSDGFAQHSGDKRISVDDLGWADPLATVRPLLSYNELGSMLEQGPTSLHDALAAILGIADLTDAAEELRQGRLDRNKSVKSATGVRDGLLSSLGEIEGDRAARARDLLNAKNWNVDSVERLVVDHELGDSDREARLAATLDVPSAAEAEEDYRSFVEASKALIEMGGTSAGRAIEIAKLLRESLVFHERHGDGDCPVCGRQDALDPAWRTRSEAAAAELEAEGAAFSKVAELADRTREILTGTVPKLPSGVQATRQGDLAPVAAWDALLVGDVTELISVGPNAIAAAAAAVSNVRDQLAIKFAAEDDAWRPIAARIAEWLPAARESQEASVEMASIKEAEDWMHAVADEVRLERFAPIADQAKDIWSKLSLNSSVVLDDVVLAGKTTRRRVDMTVSIDGEAGVALGVMSQGELHSLALSLFLPRATQPNSPFRFVVIDDPVQAMDPARVEGLAGVLSEIAKTHQVVVFTHDARLRTAFWHLDLPATVIEVTRREGSVVDLKQVDDPVMRLIDDARSLALTTELPPEVGAEVIPGFCRQAIEAACHEVVWLRHAAAGQSATDTEDLLVGLRTSQYLALALFDNADDAGKVLGKLNSWDPRFADVFKAVNKGAHGAYDGSLGTLISDTAGLCKKLRSTA